MADEKEHAMAVGIMKMTSAEMYARPVRSPTLLTRTAAVYRSTPDTALRMCTT